MRASARCHQGASKERGAINHGASPLPPWLRPSHRAEDFFDLTELPDGRFACFNFE